MTEVMCPFCYDYNELHPVEREIDGTEQKLEGNCRECKAKLTLTATQNKEAKP